MFEAVVLQKKAPEISKTPFAKLNIFYKFLMVAIPASFIWITLNHLEKKKRLIEELDEFNIDNEILTLGEQYQFLRKYWNNPYLQGSTSIVLDRYLEEGRLRSAGDCTFKEFVEKTKDIPVI